MVGTNCPRGIVGGGFAIFGPKPWFISLQFIEISHIQNNGSQILLVKGINFVKLRNLQSNRKLSGYLRNNGKNASHT